MDVLLQSELIERRFKCARRLNHPRTKERISVLTKSKCERVLAMADRLNAAENSKARLEISNIIHHSLAPGVSNADYFRFRRDPAPRESFIEGRLADQLEEMQRQGQARDLVWRIGSAGQELVEEKRFYAIFWTLTVAGDQFYSLSGKRWNSFVQELVRTTCKATYGKRAQPKGVSRSDYFGYAAVVEGPSVGKRPHIHMISFHKEIPDAWKRCPNWGKRVPSRMEVAPAKSLWAYGTSSPKAFRSSMDDPWGEIGWCWPVKDGRPLKEVGAVQAGFYLGKYAAKEKICQTETRTRYSRNLGLNLMIRQLVKVPSSILRKVTQSWTMISRSEWELTWPSRRLLKIAAMRVRKSRICSRRSLLALVKLRQMRRLRPETNLFQAMSMRLEQCGLNWLSFATLREHLEEILDDASCENYLLAQECDLIRYRRQGIV